jgi:hypothetical protein
MARGKSLVGVCSALRSFPICGVDRLSLVLAACGKWARPLGLYPRKKWCCM